MSFDFAMKSLKFICVLICGIMLGCVYRVPNSVVSDTTTNTDMAAKCQRWYDWLIEKSDTIKYNNQTWLKNTYLIYGENQDLLGYPRPTHMITFENNGTSIAATMLDTGDSYTRNIVAVNTRDTLRIINFAHDIPMNLNSLISLINTAASFPTWTKSMAENINCNSNWIVSFIKQYNNGTRKLINTSDSAIVIKYDLYDIYRHAEELKGNRPKLLAEINQSLRDELPPFEILSYDQFSRCFFPKDSSNTSDCRYSELPIKRSVFM